MNDAEELLEGEQIPLAWIIAPIGALGVVAGLLWATADSRTIWYIIRSTGTVAYVLLGASVALGLLISTRATAPGHARVDLYELHTFTSLLAVAFGVTHALSLLFDNFVTFSATQIVVPFTSDYRTFPVGLGTIGLYLAALVYGSFWARRYIGYARWRMFHYTTFAAFVLLTLHAVFSGTDAHTPWMMLILGGTSAVVAALTAWRVIRPTRRMARAA